MAMRRTRDHARQRGRIEQRGDSLQVAVYAGMDPGDRQAPQPAQQARVPDGRPARPGSSISFGHALDEWLRTIEIEASHPQDVRRLHREPIHPLPGALSVQKVDVRTLESVYTELHRCLARCDSSPFIEKHKADDDHDSLAARFRVLRRAHDVADTLPDPAAYLLRVRRGLRGCARRAPTARADVRV